MQLNTNIIIKNIERSPKFRSEYINNSIELYPEICDEICNVYQLELINQVYFVKVHVESFNSEKRKKLKQEELIFIKKILVYVELSKHYEQVLTYSQELSTIFNSNTNDSYAFDDDLIMVRIITKNYLERFAKYRESESKKP